MRSGTARAVVSMAIRLALGAVVVGILVLSVLIPRIAGGSAYTILTGSMRPGMPPGTLVVDRPTPADQIRTGDVITYQLRSGDPTVVTHRVKSVGMTMDGKYRFTVQGDANNAPDPEPVMPVQIRGVRWYSIPYLAYPSLLVNGNVREVVVMGAVAVLIGYSLASFGGAIRDRRRRKQGEADEAPMSTQRVLVKAE